MLTAPREFQDEQSPPQPQPCPRDRPMVFESLRAFYGRTIRLAERVVAGRFATARITLVAFAIGIFFSFPNYKRINDHFITKTWVGFLEKRDDLSLDMTTKYATNRHE